MIVRTVLCLLVFVGISFTLAGQSTLPSAREPEKKVVFYAPHKKVAKRKKVKIENTAQYEFYERVERAAKEKQAILKKLSKAQYSDPRYFGHKRIPKRKFSHKMKYCNECGIRH